MRLTGGQIELDYVDDLTEKKKNEGWRWLIESDQPPTHGGVDYMEYQPEYIESGDSYIQRFILQVVPELVANKIEKLKLRLAETDYIVTKFTEYNYLMITGLSSSNEEDKMRDDLSQYDLQTIFRQREKLRQEIRLLTDLLKKEEV